MVRARSTYAGAMDLAARLGLIFLSAFYSLLFQFTA